MPRLSLRSLPGRATVAPRSSGASGASGLRADALTVLSVGASGLLLGPLAGLLWYAVAPRPVLVVASDGLRYTDGASDAFFGADGWFTVIVTVVGLLSGIAAFAWRGRTGLPALLGLLLSCAVGTFLAWHLGEYLGGRSVPTDAQATAGKIGTHVTARLRLRSQGALPVWAIAATTAFFSLSLCFVDERAERHQARRRATTPPNVALHEPTDPVTD